MNLSEKAKRAIFADENPKMADWVVPGDTPDAHRTSEGWVSGEYFEVCRLRELHQALCFLNRTQWELAFKDGLAPDLPNAMAAGKPN